MLYPFPRAHRRRVSTKVRSATKDSFFFHPCYVESQYKSRANQDDPCSSLRSHSCRLNTRLTSPADLAHIQPFTILDQRCHDLGPLTRRFCLKDSIVCLTCSWEHALEPPQSSRNPVDISDGREPILSRPVSPR